MTAIARTLAGVVLALAAGTAPAAAKDGGPAGDPVVGKEIYSRCLACHALAYDRTGPRHCGLLGRHAGSVPGFAYSDAMKRSGIVWNEKNLDRFLANPMGFVPGTAMGYSGIVDKHERADLIAYLRRATTTPECAGK